MQHSPVRSRSAPWQPSPRAIEVGTLTLLVLAGGTGMIALAVEGASAAGYLGPVLVLAGAALSYRHPIAGLLVVVAAAGAVAISGEVPTAPWSMVCFAALLLTYRGLSAVLVGFLLGAANFVSAAITLGTINLNADPTASVFAFAAVMCAAIGSAVRANLRYRREVEARIRDAEAVRIASVDRGVARERLRIARDLHDSVGHQITVVNMRLGAAEVSLPGNPGRAIEEIAGARQAVQAVLRETQQILKILRLGGDSPPPEAIPDRDMLDNLVTGYRHAGMVIEDRIEDVDGALSPEARIAVYRIIQEALTNARRYGRGSASVTVGPEGADTVRIDVVNTVGAQTSPEGGGGNGLIGMRERAASVEGTVEARDEDGVFWLTARIPTAGGVAGAAP
ncbi:sensor histidine kinase [Millisia brevis]|uniref:sensor histidine kinase n=1 Tax=Millisia brevis TaxID=264148 RepID=UPI00083503A9|nr:histidine kinase [Millisia brevis]